MYAKEGKIDKATKKFEEAKRVALELERLEVTLNILNSLLVSFIQEKQIKETTIILKKVKKIISLINDKEKKSDIQLN